MMQRKKAMIEVQFNWIFIVIAGIVIIMFFIGISSWYKQNEDRKIASDVLTELKTIIIGAEVSSRSASELNVPRIQLQFTCDPGQCGAYGCASSMVFQGTGIEEDTPMDIIFSPDTVTSDFLYAWSLDWDMPYKVTNFLYITSPDVKYVLVYKDETDPSKKLAAAAYQKMLENEYVQKNTLLINESMVSSVSYENEYLVRFVWFYDPAGTVSFSDSMKKGKKDAILITGDSKKGIVNFGTLSGNYYTFNDLDYEYPYLGLPSLIGAIFSEDFGSYECNMKKAFLRLRSVNSVYLDRTEKLYSSFAGDQRCEYYYDTEVQQSFTKIDDSTQSLDRSNIESTLGAMVTSAGNIETMNSNTELKSCPRIY